MKAEEQAFSQESDFDYFSRLHFYLLPLFVFSDKLFQLISSECVMLNGSLS